MVDYKLSGSPAEPKPNRRGGVLQSGLTRAIYRAQTGSEIGKRIRWFAETTIASHILPNKSMRNAILNKPVSTLASRDRNKTDILHEYFLPAECFSDFIVACQEIIPRHWQDCLNVTMRYVGADHESILAYAPDVRVAAVMAFAQNMTSAAESHMRVLTGALINRAIELGGSFYLPYRLHAHRDQVRAAYGNTQYFIDRKHQYDPRLLFRNAMWHAYFN